MIALSATVLAQALASTPGVPSDPSPTPAPARPVVTHVWYGYQTLAVDVVAVAVAGIGGAVVSENSRIGVPAILTGVVIYGLGPPVVHVVHGRLVVGAADLAIRLASNFVGLATAASAFVFSDEVTGTPLYIAIGAVAMGVLVPVVLDAALASSATVVRYPDRPPTISSSWSLAPFVSSVRGVGDAGKRSAAAVFGIGGTF